MSSLLRLLWGNDASRYLSENRNDRKNHTKKNGNVLLKRCRRLLINISNTLYFCVCDLCRFLSPPSPSGVAENYHFAAVSIHWKKRHQQSAAVNTEGKHFHPRSFHFSVTLPLSVPSMPPLFNFMSLFPSFSLSVNYVLLLWSFSSVILPCLPFPVPDSICVSSHYFTSLAAERTLMPMLQVAVTLLR